MNAQSIRFEKVSKRFGADAAAVNEVSFTVAAGSLVTLLGPSGCGKTTTLRMIAGLEMASAGRIFIGGAEVTHMPASERDVSMVFQSYALFPHMSVFDNVAYGLTVRRRTGRLPRTDIAARVERALLGVGLQGFAARLPSELSGGQQQRVALARALVLEPAVLLFDEPLSNLDARLRRQMREEIRELQQRLNLTVVYVTHDQAEAMAVSDRIIVMNRAVIAQEGAPDELYLHPVSKFVAAFMGEANQVRGVWRRVDEQTGELALGGLDGLDGLDGLSLRLPHRNIAEGAVDVSIRPEAIVLSAEKPAGHASIAATVKKSTWLGGVVETTLSCALGELLAIHMGVRHRFAAGQEVHLGLRGEGVIVMPSS